ncbi:helix-turn-helix domain-containing protein [Streptomyces sp. NPDC046759]|uniref:helix-turn-helix domain-containing protein n=1 Tax=Streptomyces sp. NPDC046759 TaxID=3155019 RepID=UPI0033EDF940
MRRPVQDRSKAKREDLLDAAARLFAERGYAHTTVEDILKRACMSKGAMYHYFRSKQELAQAVVTEGFSMDAAQRGLPRLQSVVDASIALAVLTPQVPVVKAAARLATEQDHPFYGHLWRGYIPQVTALLTESHDLGELLPGVDPALTARTWVAAYTGIDMMQRRDYHLLPQEIAPMNAQMVRGIATPETLMRLDVSVERGYRLMQESRWAAGYLSSAKERERP